MNQSSYIAGFLLTGFILFLAVNNRLSAYAAVLWGSSAASGSSGSVAPNGSAAPPGNSKPAAAPQSSSSSGSSFFGTLANPLGSLESQFASPAALASSIGSFLGL